MTPSKRDCVKLCEPAQLLDREQIETLGSQHTEPLSAGLLHCDSHAVRRPLLAHLFPSLTATPISEIIWFRRNSGPLGEINPDDFNDFSKLPPGFVDARWRTRGSPLTSPRRYACIGAIAVAIGGIVPSMAETYYIGPIALAVAKPYGGDLGETRKPVRTSNQRAQADAPYPRFRVLCSVHGDCLFGIPNA